jgi:hypothetical protein
MITKDEEKMNKITAAEARELSYRIVANEVDKEVEAVWTMIREAAMKGEFSIRLQSRFWIDDGYKPRARARAIEQLEKAWFKVTFRRPGPEYEEYVLVEW